METNKKTEDAANDAIGNLNSFVENAKKTKEQADKRMDLLGSLFKAMDEKTINFNGNEVRVCLSERGYITLGMDIKDAKKAFEIIIKALDGTVSN